MNVETDDAARVTEALGTPFAGSSTPADRSRRVRVSIRVLSIEALIEEKRALGRYEDRAVLHLLEAVQALQRRHRGAQAD